MGLHHLWIIHHVPKYSLLHNPVPPPPLHPAMQPTPGHGWGCDFLKPRCSLLRALCLLSPRASVTAGWGPGFRCGRRSQRVINKPRCTFGSGCTPLMGQLPLRFMSSSLREAGRCGCRCGPCLARDSGKPGLAPEASRGGAGRFCSRSPLEPALTARRRLRASETHDLGRTQVPPCRRASPRGEPRAFSEPQLDLRCLCRHVCDVARRAMVFSVSPRLWGALRGALAR